MEGYWAVGKVDIVYFFESQGCFWCPELTKRRNKGRYLN